MGGFDTSGQKNPEVDASSAQAFGGTIVIWEIVGARSRAVAADRLPDYFSHAEMAETLVRFFKGPDLALIPMIDPSMIASVEKVAQQLRAIAQKSRIHRSRKGRSGDYTLFMRQVSLTMHGWYGHWFDDVVADLTNIFFPEAYATTDSVRATRRPTTSKGRSASLGIVA